MRIYNTLTGRKEDFQPLNENSIKIYVCGPTVYDYSHIGHARSAIAFDIIRRYLEWRFKDKAIVEFIVNFTDVDDKMINRANKEGITIFELSNRFITQYLKDMDALNVKRATYYPRATENIPDMIKFINGLIDRGFAYEVEGNVYFNIEKFDHYGQLSHKKLEELQPSQEEESIKKGNPKDFALWKKRKESEPYWDSPWGPGRPGWHIECSTMSMKYLGETFDIHGGGLDLVFPHHENEIAQSEGLTGKPFVSFFIHNNFITINKEKMSKSLGNFFTIEEIIQKYHPMVLRFFLISTHYRSPIDFDEAKIKQTETSYNRLNLALAYSGQKHLEGEGSKELSDTLEELIQSTRENFIAAMDDDFSTPRAIASINGLVRHLNKLASMKEAIRPESLRNAYDTLRELCFVLGLVRTPKMSQREIMINNLMSFIIELRNNARDNKEYELADRIRDKLKQLGITILDYSNKTIWI
ncbi:MAG TPA: cysteine--tRNA ligase [Candidatus Deferrimicrobium sp.]|nr:cysteine--tRNA ligase [Candidatus Deferrimicrobium sp.]